MDARGRQVPPLLCRISISWHCITPSNRIMRQHRVALVSNLRKPSGRSLEETGGPAEIWAAQNAYRYAGRFVHAHIEGRAERSSLSTTGRLRYQPRGESRVRNLFPRALWAL